MGVIFSNVAKDDFPIFCELQIYHDHTGPKDHTHDCLELVYVVRGGGRHWIDGEPYPLVPGDLYAIEMGTSHAFTAESGLWFYNILVKPELFDARELRELAALHPFAGFLRGQSGAARRKLSFSPPLSDQLAALLEELSRECMEKPPGWRLSAKAIFSRFVVAACRPTSAASAAPPASQGPVAVALGRIHERYTEPLTVEGLARVAGCSSGHLGEAFKERTGLTIHQYLTRLRIARVRELLSGTALSITAICHQVGFEDSGYLGRMFKRLVGTTPSAYRAAARKDALARNQARPGARARAVNRRSGGVRASPARRPRSRLQELLGRRTGTHHSRTARAPAPPSRSPRWGCRCR